VALNEGLLAIKCLFVSTTTSSHIYQLNGQNYLNCKITLTIMLEHKHVITIHITYMYTDSI